MTLEALFEGLGLDGEETLARTEEYEELVQRVEAALESEDEEEQ